MASKPARKRIVPQLVVASPEGKGELGDAPGGEAWPAAPRLSLPEQARIGKEALGLDRKIYVDLSNVDEKSRVLNYKQVGWGQPSACSCCRRRPTRLLETSTAASIPPSDAPPTAAPAAAQGARRAAHAAGGCQARTRL